MESNLNTKSKELDAVCKECKIIIFSYPEPYKRVYDTQNFCCLSCYLSKLS